MPVGLALWSQDSKRLFLICMYARRGNNYHLEDEVGGADEATLDTCLSKCREKGATFMALKVILN